MVWPGARKADDGMSREPACNCACTMYLPLRPVQVAFALKREVCEVRVTSIIGWSSLIDWPAISPFGSSVISRPGARLKLLGALARGRGAPFKAGCWGSTTAPQRQQHAGEKSGPFFDHTRPRTHKS